MTNINVNAGIGVLDLLTSGSVLTHDNSPVEFKIGNLSFELMFYEDKSISTNKIEFDTPATKTNKLIIKITNFNNVIGTMNKSLLQVGTLANRLLYFSFIVYNIENNNRVIHYSWFLGQTQS